MSTYIKPYGMWVGNVTPEWLLRRKDVTSSTKLVYGQLVKHAGVGKYYCWPGVNVLAEALGMSERTVRRSIEDLVNYQLVEVRHNVGESNNYYFLQHHWMTDAPPQRDRPSRPDPTAYPGQDDRHKTVSKRDRRRELIPSSVRRAAQEIESPALGEDPDEPRDEPRLQPQHGPGAARHKKPKAQPVPHQLATRFVKEAEARHIDGNGPVTGIEMLRKHFSRLLAHGRSRKYCDEMIDMFCEGHQRYTRRGIPPARAFVAASSAIQAKIDKRDIVFQHIPTLEVDNPWA